MSHFLAEVPHAGEVCSHMPDQIFTAGFLGG